VRLVAESGLYDYRAKYQSPGRANVVPAELPDAWAGSLAVAAVRATAVLGCRGRRGWTSGWTPQASRGSWR